MGCTLKLQVDINCDLGESYGIFKIGNDTQVMPYITSANIACGLHAGDPMIMAQTIRLAKQHDVAVGAHPGYPDLLGFGRREMQLTPEEVKNFMVYQIGALSGMAKALGTTLQHVKPHGALYNKAAKDEETAKAIAEAVRAVDSRLIIFAPPMSVLATVAADNGLRVAFEVFADRAYNADGSLVSRQHPNVIWEEPRMVVERTIRMVKDGTVLAVDGSLVKLGVVHTICVHGDTPTASGLVRALKEGLVKAGVEVTPAGSFIG